MKKVIPDKVRRRISNEYYRDSRNVYNEIFKKIKGDERLKIREKEVSIEWGLIITIYESLLTDYSQTELMILFEEITNGNKEVVIDTDTIQDMLIRYDRNYLAQYIVSKESKDICWSRIQRNRCLGLAMAIVSTMIRGCATEKLRNIVLDKFIGSTLVWVFDYVCHIPFAIREEFELKSFSDACKLILVIWLYKNREHLRLSKTDIRGMIVYNFREEDLEELIDDDTLDFLESMMEDRLLGNDEERVEELLNKMRKSNLDSQLFPENIIIDREDTILELKDSLMENYSIVNLIKDYNSDLKDKEEKIEKYQKDLEVNDKELKGLRRDLNRAKNNLEKDKLILVEKENKIEELKSYKQANEQNEIIKQNNKLKAENKKITTKKINLEYRINKLEEKLTEEKRLYKDEIKKNKELEVELEIYKKIASNNEMESKNVTLTEEQINKVKQLKVAIVGGPKGFSQIIKKALPNSEVIMESDDDTNSIVVPDKYDYIAIYYRIISHKIVFQLESIAKAKGKKSIYLANSNVNKIYESLYNLLIENDSAYN